MVRQRRSATANNGRAFTSRALPGSEVMSKIVAALITAALMLTAMPAAQAQSFGIFFGDEPSDFFGEDDDDIFRRPERILCMTDRQIRNAVADMGYGNIALNAPNEKNIQVRATRDGATYLLDFNFCSGEVEGRQRLR
jgi:hypothetical protein